MSIKKNAFWLLLLLSACSDAPEKADPHQEFNKDMLNFNLALDENIVHPVSDVYKEGTSDNARYAIGSFLNNLKEPYYMLNYIIAGNPEKAATLRFFMCFVDSSINLSRSSMEKNGFLLRLLNTQTINSSNILPARSKISICPFVTGSKLPEQTALVIDVKPPRNYRYTMLCLP